MSIDTEVDADPASCRETARALRLLADALDESSAFARSYAELSLGDFDGVSNAAFRQACTTMADRAAETRTRLDLVAFGLTRYAQGIELVEATMLRARQVALHHLRLEVTQIWPAPDPASPRQQRIHAAVAANVAAARAEEQRLQLELLGVLSQHGDVDGPPPINPGPPISHRGIPRYVRAKASYGVPGQWGVEHPDRQPAADPAAPPRPLPAFAPIARLDPGEPALHQLTPTRLADLALRPTPLDLDWQSAVPDSPAELAWLPAPSLIPEETTHDC